MYVCICNAVKEKQILQAIAEGDDTLEKLQASLEVATCCGGCQPMIEGYLEEAQSYSMALEVVVDKPKLVSGVEIFIPKPSTMAA